MHPALDRPGPARSTRSSIPKGRARSSSTTRSGRGRSSSSSRRRAPAFSTTTTSLQATCSGTTTQCSRIIATGRERRYPSCADAVRRSSPSRSSTRASCVRAEWRSGGCASPAEHLRATRVTESIKPDPVVLIGRTPCSEQAPRGRSQGVRALSALPIARGEARRRRPLSTSSSAIDDSSRVSPSGSEQRTCCSPVVFPMTSATPGTDERAPTSARRSTKGSALPSSKRSPTACRSSHERPAPFPRRLATRESCSTTTTRRSTPKRCTRSSRRRRRGQQLARAAERRLAELAPARVAGDSRTALAPVLDGT